MWWVAQPAPQMTEINGVKPLGKKHDCGSPSLKMFLFPRILETAQSLNSPCPFFFNFGLGFWSWTCHLSE